ncbi:MAG: FAD-binding oxidoreductase [Candidatus Lokiarchaeota archaeon]|nr:FAD-binding oxidoreductase [Candidatus Lokiarchaeota archaeon]
MKQISLIKDLQNRLPWDKFIEEMEKHGFFKLTFIKTSKVSDCKSKYQSIQTGYLMLVGDPIQASAIRDTSLLHIRPYVLFRPKLESQLRVILKNSQKFSIPITFAGGKTGLSGGYSNYGIIIDMTDLRSYEEPFRYDFKNNTVRVNQNVLISDLIKYTIVRSNNKLIFPVQPASSLKLPVRVGGLIASNASGITSGKLGSVENWVENIRIMRPDGTMVKVDENNPLFSKIIGGNGYFGVILSAVFKLYSPETNLKQAILYGFNITNAFNGLQSVLDSKIFPLVSEFVISDLKLPGKFNKLGEQNSENNSIKWAVMIKGTVDIVDKFIDSMKEKAHCYWNILSEKEFQDFLQERSAFALLVQTEDSTSDFIAFPGFEDVLSEPKNLPNTIKMINEIFTKKGFHKVIFGYGHINFRKGQGLLLHMRLPVPIEYFYKENKESMKLVCETVYDVILNLKTRFDIKHKAEHSAGPFKIWLESKFRSFLRKKVIEGEAFKNPHLEIFDELLIRNLGISNDELMSNDKEENLSTKLKKELFVVAMISYLTGE